MAITTAITAAVGVGISGYSAYEGMQAADENKEFQQQQADAANARTAQQNAQAQKQIAIQKQIIGKQREAQDVYQEAAQLDARRRTLESLRQGQQARALAISTAFNQGAGYGSGLQGGLAQVQGKTAFNVQGITQNLSLNNSLFGINSDISTLREQLAETGFIEGAPAFINGSGSRAAFAQGLASFAGSAVSATNTVIKAFEPSRNDNPVDVGSATSFGAGTDNYSYSQNSFDYTQHGNMTY